MTYYGKEARVPPSGIFLNMHMVLRNWKELKKVREAIWWRMAP